MIRRVLLTILPATITLWWLHSPSPAIARTTVTVCDAELTTSDPVFPAGKPIPLGGGGCGIEPGVYHYDVYRLDAWEESHWKLATTGLWDPPAATHLSLVLYEESFNPFDPCTNIARWQNQMGPQSRNGMLETWTPAPGDPLDQGTYYMVVIESSEDEHRLGPYKASAEYDLAKGAFWCCYQNPGTYDGFGITPGKPVDGSIHYVHGVLDIPRYDSLFQDRSQPTLWAAGHVELGDASGRAAYAGWVVFRCGANGERCIVRLAECDLDSPDFVGPCLFVNADELASPVSMGGIPLPASNASAVENPATGRPFQFGEQVVARLWTTTGTGTGLRILWANFGGVTPGQVHWLSPGSEQSYYLANPGTILSWIGSGVSGLYTDTVLPTHSHSWNAYSTAPQLLPDGHTPDWTTAASWCTHYCYTERHEKFAAATGGIPYYVSPCDSARWSWDMNVN